MLLSDGICAELSKGTAIKAPAGTVRCQVRPDEIDNVLAVLRGAREFLIRPEAPRAVEIADASKKGCAKIDATFDGILIDGERSIGLQRIPQTPVQHLLNLVANGLPLGRVRVRPAKTEKLYGST